MEKYINNLDEITSSRMARELKDYKLEEDEYIFHFDKNITCTPFGMLLTGNTIRNFRNKFTDKPFYSRTDKSASSIQYAGHMGFFKFISEDINFGKYPGEAEGSNQYIPITKVDFVNYRKGFFQYTPPLYYIEYQSRILSKVLANGDRELEELFTFLIREIIRNSQEHGDTDCSWICAQNWKSKNLAEIAILDNGIGYKESLRKKFGNKIETDEIAISYAIRPGISESYIKKNPDIDDNSGFGLYMISEVCNELNGKFTVATGDCMLTKRDGAIAISKSYVNGVIIKIAIDTSIKFNKSKLLENISNKGEHIIKSQIKASELSKGKFVMN